MTYRKEIILCSLVGGLGMLIVNQLGFTLNYISGLLIPVVYLSSIIMSMFSIKRKGVMKYSSFVRVGFMVSFGVSVLAILVNSFTGDFKVKFPDFIVVFAILVISGLFLSVLTAFFFRKKVS